MIHVACPGCNRTLRVKDELAGKRGVCPHCRQRMTVPTATVPNIPDAATVTGTPLTDLDGEALDFLAPPQGAGELGRLGTYRILRLLGAGGMGLVLHAEDLLLKRAVALKVMRPELAKSKDSRQRFLREARAIAAIEHRHIVTVYQVAEDRGVPFLAMPFLKGESLEQRLKRERKLSVADSVSIGRQIAEGLAVAHKNDLIHRDIKPGNIWLEEHDDPRQPRDWIKLLDFGLARADGDDGRTLTKLGTILGTPGYMAPEQARGLKVDARCDLFSLGAVFYRMLTGTLPFKGTDVMSQLMSLAADTPRPVREKSPEVPSFLADLVIQLLAKDPNQRPASARAVADALTAFEAGSARTADSAAPRRQLTADERALLEAPTRLGDPAEARQFQRPERGSDNEDHRRRPVSVGRAARSSPPTPLCVWAILGLYSLAFTGLFVIYPLILALIVFDAEKLEPLVILVFLIVYLGILILWKAGMLFVPILFAFGRPIRRISLLPLLIASGAFYAVLTLCCVGALEEGFRWRLSGWMILFLGIASWVGWSAIFAWMSRKQDPTAFGCAASRLLLRGILFEWFVFEMASIVYCLRQRWFDWEFAVILPWMLNITLILLACGPGIVVMFLRRVRRMQIPKIDNQANGPVAVLWYSGIGLILPILLVIVNAVLILIALIKKH
jgi:serine/threonine protein kinase